MWGLAILGKKKFLVARGRKQILVGPAFRWNIITVTRNPAKLNFGFTV